MLETANLWSPSVDLLRLPEIHMVCWFPISIMVGLHSTVATSCATDGVCCSDGNVDLMTLGLRNAMWFGDGDGTFVQLSKPFSASGSGDLAHADALALDFNADGLVRQKAKRNKTSHCNLKTAHVCRWISLLTTRCTLDAAKTDSLKTQRRSERGLLARSQSLCRI